MRECWHRPGSPILQAPAAEIAGPARFLARVGGKRLDALSAADGAATLVAFTTEAVARAPLPAPPLRWLVTGGGRHNPSIMAALAGRLARPCSRWKRSAGTATCWRRSASASWRYASLRGLPLSLPTTTGVASPMCGGRLAPVDLNRPLGRRLSRCALKLRRRVRSRSHAAARSRSGRSGRRNGRASTLSITSPPADRGPAPPCPPGPAHRSVFAPPPSPRCLPMLPRAPISAP